MTTIVGEYYRSRDGKTIHWAPCPRMGTAVQWRFADGMSLHAVADVVATHEWLRLCRHCWPSEAIAATT